MTGPLTAIINQSLSTDVFPVVCKHAYVCPLPKHGDPTLASNYRPVSLLSVASKRLAKIVKQQLVQYFASFPEVEALPTEQIAYRQYHSCEDLLANAINTWQTGLEKDLFCRDLFRDMSKAFDRVQHIKLLAELAAVGIGGLVLAWISDNL